MMTLFARAGAAMLPGASRLPFVGGGGGDVPDLALTLEGVEIDRGRLADYDRVCSFPVADRVPATYPHVLAFALHLALITDGSFPLAAIGLVHIANRIVQHRPIDARERLSLRVWATACEPHLHGTQFAIHSQARVGDELVWEESSTNLMRGTSNTAARAPQGPPRRLALAPTATWHLKSDLGRRYGSVSGDLNPIHLHPLTARTFGFRSAIAHGMWTMARCLAALDPELPGAFAVEAAFKRPILLPARVNFAEVQGGSEIRFEVCDFEGHTPHLDGIVRLGRGHAPRSDLSSASHRGRP